MEDVYVTCHGPVFVIEMLISEDLLSMALCFDVSFPVDLVSCHIVMSEVVVTRNLTVLITGYVSSGPQWSLIWEISLLLVKRLSMWTET